MDYTVTIEVPLETEEQEETQPQEDQLGNLIGSTANAVGSVLVGTGKVLGAIYDFIKPENTANNEEN